MRFKSFFESFENKAVVFDVDDTLFTTDAKVIVNKSNGEVLQLTPAEFNTYQKAPDDKMDYSQFRDPELFLRTAKPTKYIKVAQNISNARDAGRSDTKLYILTARDASIEKALTQKLASLGITHDGFFSAGDTGAPTIAEGKKQILEKIRSMHRGRVTFFDDDEQNIALAKQIPGINVRHVSKESLNRLDESWVDDSMSDSVDWSSLYMQHLSGVRESARKLGIDLESARLINSKRPSLKDIKDVSVDPKYHQWYSIGTAWLDWIEGNMPNWLAPCTYAIVLDENAITNIDNLVMIDSFQKSGGIIKGKEDFPKDSAIDWANLYKSNYGAIEFNPYLGHIGGKPLKPDPFKKTKSVVGDWYNSIDMSSGAIINKKCIKKIIKLYDGTEDFMDMGIKI